MLSSVEMQLYDYLAGNDEPIMRKINNITPESQLGSEENSLCLGLIAILMFNFKV